MTPRILFLVAACSLPACPQSWSAFLDPSRAINWSSAGFTIPNYSVNCATQPSLLTGSSNASANTTAIQNALASCDATHNVVNIPAGTYYVAGWTYGSQGKQVVRGAGPASTYIYLTTDVGCAGLTHGVCMLASNWTYSGASNVLPPGGSNQCLWTGGYAQGSTTLTLSSCGGTPPVNATIILDQADDTSDTGGVYMCDTNVANCSYEFDNGNTSGRQINGTVHSMQQVVYVTGVTSLGSGSFTVTISPGVYFTNIRSSQNPGVWWPGFVQNDGIENITLDGSSDSGGTLSMFSCYECWAKNVRFINGARNAVLFYQSLKDVVRDSYFYGAQSHLTTSYTIESDFSSGFLIENNIFQQVTTPLTFIQATGAVVNYNFAVKDIFSNSTWTWGMYASHQVGNNFDLFEGNDVPGIWADNAAGPSSQMTIFRNLLSGYEPGTTNSTLPTNVRANSRVFNYVGNVLGQPGYHTQYQTYATSATAGTGASNENVSIYDFGWGGTGPICGDTSGQSTSCDPLTFSTAMRWGNYDVVNAATRWNTTEASPAAVTYVNANFSSSYFGTLAQTLPASLYYSAQPSWWPTGKAWPAIGPDVSSGNVGICTGTYAGAQGTSASQCSGGTLTSAWASHANSIPAQDCYLNTMQGPPDGSGSVLSFDASLCYTSATPPASPTGLKATAK